MDILRELKIQQGGAIMALVYILALALLGLVLLGMWVYASGQKQRRREEKSELARMKRVTDRFEDYHHGGSTPAPSLFVPGGLGEPQSSAGAYDGNQLVRSGGFWTHRPMPRRGSTLAKKKRVASARRFKVVVTRRNRRVTIGSLSASNRQHAQRQALAMARIKPLGKNPRAVPVAA